MKKIYSLAAGLIFCGSMVGQSVFSPSVSQKQKALAPVNAPSSSSRVLGPKYWVDPVGDIMNTMGIDLTGASSGQSQGNFLDIVYMDSTVRVSNPTGTSHVSTIALGSVLDPKSSYLKDDFTPILTNTEAYSIDSIQIVGSYVKVTAAVDTLYTWLVWGDTASTTVFSKRTTSSIWVAPINTWRSHIIGPKVTGYNAAPGNRIKAGAPVSNRMLVKYVLTTDDEATGPGYSKIISIALPTPANIPAGNVVSCFYTFVPGAPNALGDVAYSFDTSPDPQTVNGFAGMIWAQTSPQLTALADYENHQVDPDGFNMGTTYGKNQRHAAYPAAYNNSLWGDLVNAPLIFYSIYSNTSVSIAEKTNNFYLGQNTPNPFTNLTKISYQLNNSAKSVSLAVYNVAGVKVFERSQSNVGSGSYSVDIADADFPAGLYFYTLTVDGNQATKKMTVTK